MPRRALGSARVHPPGAAPVNRASQRQRSSQQGKQPRTEVGRRTRIPGDGPGLEPAGRQEHLRRPAAGSAGLDYPGAACRRLPAGQAAGRATGLLASAICNAFDATRTATCRAPGLAGMTISRRAGSVITPKAWGPTGGWSSIPGMAGEVTADFPSLRHQGVELIRPEHDGLEEALQWAHRVLARTRRWRK